MLKYALRVYKDLTEWWLNCVWHRVEAPAADYMEDFDHTKGYLNGKFH